MTNRTYLLLLGLACLGLTPLALLGIYLVLEGPAIVGWLLIGLGAGAPGLALRLFWHALGMEGDRATFDCPYCKTSLDPLALPASGGDYLCPNCGLPMSQDPGGLPGALPKCPLPISPLSLALGPCPRCGRFDGLGGELCKNCGKKLAGAHLENQDRAGEAPGFTCRGA
jgi:predicted amidophosphoribosyltransferase